jgi:hypothetical protein
MKGSVGFQRIRSPRQSYIVHRFSEVENGVVITQSGPGTTTFSVTHARSGMAIAKFETLQAARRCWLLLVESKLNWNLPAKIILKKSQQHVTFWKNEIKPLPERVIG